MDKKNSHRWLGFAAAGLLAVALSGCGGDDGATGPQGEPGTPGTPGATGPAGPAGPAGSTSMSVGSNALTNANAVAANAEAWAALEPTVTVTGVTIASPPVVTFMVKDGFGRAVVGLGNTTKASTAKFPSYANLAFSLAKLVPGTNGSPSKWVSYLVTTVPPATATASTVCATDLGCPTRPSTDNTGTLVDNGDGTYKYTFWRDITAAKAQVAAMAASAAAVSANNKVADLGDLTYDPALTHRVTVVISGNAPGTGTNTSSDNNNTPNGKPGVIAAVPMKKPVDMIYDFIPATGAPVSPTSFSREIVANANCEACHRKLGGIPGLSEAEASAGFHGGSRNNVQYCVVCHTEQRKYGRTEATATLDGAVKTFTSTTYRLDDRAVGNLPNFIHKVHLAKLLTHKEYDYGEVLLNEPTYPQDIRNCTSCHDGSATKSRTTKTKDGDNWKNNPSTLACGACHDGINFATGKGVTIADAAKGLTSSPDGHIGGPASDAECALCHKPTYQSNDLNHLPVTPPNPTNSLLAGQSNSNTNAAWIASGGSTGRVPEGAIKVTYDVKSVSAVDIGGALRPRMVFRMLQNCNETDVTKCASTNLNNFDTATPNPATGKKEIWPNFMGAPSVYFVFAVPQDNIAKPADFNASVSAYLRCLWNGTTTLPQDPGYCVAAGTLTGPDASGYYTATLTGAIVPANAVMLTGGLGYSYNVRTALPLTQTNLADYPTAPATNPGVTVGYPNTTGGLIVIAPNVQKVADGYTGRRVIVEDARCNACHQELGTFTEDAFHAGQRNDGTTCSWCHRPNQTSNGWSADSTPFVHAIHAPAKRANDYVWHATQKPGTPSGSLSKADFEGFWEVTYPGILNDCQTCHLPGTYDYSNVGTASTPTALGTAIGAWDGVDKRQFRTVGTGTYTAAFANSPWIKTGVNYGAGFSYTATTGVTVEAAATTLVTSPTVTVCSACHDTADAISHYKINGGAFYGERGTASNETCLVCHGNGRTADIAAMHSKNR